MNPHDISSELKKIGLSHQDIGRLLGVSRGAIGSVIAGKSRSERIERVIADQLKMSLEELWPQHYGHAGGVLLLVPKGVWRHSTVCI